MKQSISILLVDDDQLVCTCIAAWLEDEGFEVRIAADAQEALGLMDRLPVDLALVDLHLGDLSGEEFIVRASARHPDSRFMIHTGKHFYQLPARLLALGMRQQDVVFKPIFDLDAFAASIRRLVSGEAADV